MKRALTLAITITAALLATECFGATAYTSATAFNSAVSSFGFEFVRNLDSQADGSTVGTYGMMGITAQSISADGLQVSLSPIATAAYATSSSPNALGVSATHHQFLSGKSDSIIWTFSRPIHAFGVCLIGNPSPTGTPAIPFWKLHLGNGFDALSDTVPLSTISKGNDVYFLGVIDPSEPFTMATLSSDNDPAACFSFNVDDITVAADYFRVSIQQAKTIPSGDVVLSGLAVTRVHWDRFYVEMPDRSAGMAVMNLGTGVTATRGMMVDVLGSLTANSDDERVLTLVHMAQTGNADPPNSLGMGSLSLGGGGSVGLQVGCDGSVGPNNIGLDVLVWGKVTGVSPDKTWIVVDDGTGSLSGLGFTGVVVTAPWYVPGMPSPPAVGKYINVRGSSSLYKIGSTHYPLVRVAALSDIIAY